MKDNKPVIIGLIIGITIVVFGTIFSYKYINANSFRRQFLIVNIPISIKLEDSYYEHIHEEVHNYGIFLTSIYTQYTEREPSGPVISETEMITLYDLKEPPIVYLSIVNIIIDVIIIISSVFILTRVVNKNI